MKKPKVQIVHSEDGYIDPVSQPMALSQAVVEAFERVDSLPELEILKAYGY